MSDYSELKRLAEAALRNWPDSKLFERPECERFIDASRPDVVLALIGENDALAGLLKRFVDGEHEQDENQAERHMYFTEAQSLLALVSGELEAHTIVPDSAIKAAHSERDQLRAEVAGLRTGYEAYEQVNAGLKAECEELRKDSKDAERYRWLIRNAEEIYFSGTNLDLAPFHAEHEKIKKIKEGADSDIDAAMRKGVQS